MREILFRGKRVDNGEWITGDLITTPFLRREEGAESQEILYILDVTKADYDCFEDLKEDNGIFEVILETVSQYTGLIDKYGRRIFENDILEAVDYRVRKGLVKFGLYKQGGMESDYECGNQGFYVWFDVKFILRPDIYYWNGNSVVVGNIFDNPELLKDGD